MTKQEATRLSLDKRFKSVYEVLQLDALRVRRKGKPQKRHIARIETRFVRPKSLIRKRNPVEGVAAV